MKSQKHNQGDLVELKLDIEKEVHESLTRMSANSGLTMADIVVIALKRFRSQHSDYEAKEPNLDS